MSDLVLVPREPTVTKEMRLAANRVWAKGDRTAYFPNKVNTAVEAFPAMFAAMIASAPPQEGVRERAVEAFRAWYFAHTGKRIFASNAGKAVDTILSALQGQGAAS